MKNIIYYLIAGTRGGEARARIINHIDKTPCNAHVLSKELELDYKTIQHHLKILSKHRIIEKQGTHGGVYFLTEFFKQNMSHFKDIWDKFGNNSGKSF